MTSTGCMSSTSGPDPLTLSWMATPVEIGRPPGTGSCGGQCDLYRATSGPRSIGRLQTLRLDRWWLRPLEAALYLGGISTYATWAALQTKYYATGSYISPLYSPCIASSCGTHATIALIGGWWRWSPALLVVAAPVGVRATCYYYRKLYYRSFWLSPPACAVVDPHQTYSGESRFPLVLQNAHRYFWMLSILVAIMLTADSVMAFRQPGGIGLGLGTALLTCNAVAFWAYVLSCHAFRHLVGGGLRSFSGNRMRHRVWRVASALNRRHGLFALVSLPLVVITDGYVRLVASGSIADPHLVLMH
jgi:hypothetical protein